MVNTSLIDPIVVLGGGLAKDKEGTWRTTFGAFQSGNSGILDDRLRVFAAYEIWKIDKARSIVASGGRGALDNELPPGVTIATVISDELAALGVPREMIVLDNESGSTFQQLRWLAKALDNGYAKGKAEVISNDYHLPRIDAMVNYTDLASKLKNKISLVGAEDILLKSDKARWSDYLGKRMMSKDYILRLNEEKKGVEHIKSGTYKFK